MTVFFNVLTFTSLPASSLSEIFGNTSPTDKTPPFEVVADFDSGLTFFVIADSSLSAFAFVVAVEAGPTRFLLFDVFVPSLDPVILEEEEGGAARFAIREDVLLVASVVDMINNYILSRFPQIRKVDLKIKRNKEEKVMVVKNKDANTQR